MICLECGGRMREVCGPITESYKGREYTVEGIKRHECEGCGERIISAEEADKASKAIAEMHRRSEGLLLPEEIREVRKRLGLKQRDFESLLGVSSPTASRWENGAMIQSKTADNLIRILSSHPELARELDGAATPAVFQKQARTTHAGHQWAESENSHDKKPLKKFEIVIGGLAA